MIDERLRETSPIRAEMFGDGICYAAVVSKELDSETLPLMMG